ncbi:MAG: hypothetical protein GTO63_20060, partial [Anaerolineae bacterium]|nr:hypothetical protein [Anaerolineae bacterium]NIN97075.1 hypothetical protein [Anaerolineae bacterium]NIQ80024.1 hypothetical protein [Anaerolineae bacterium]
MVENLPEAGKLNIARVQAQLEPTLVYPFVPWKNVHPFCAQPADYILMVQDPDRRSGYEENWLKLELPHTYSYLKGFEATLRGRSGYKKYFDPRVDPFYSIYNVGPDTMTKHKVIWKRMGTSMEAAVVAHVHDEFVGEKPPMHKSTVMLIATDSLQEAHFLCALLNSSIVDFIARSYSVGKSFASAHLLGYA